jgi:hypothetical protein
MTGARVVTAVVAVALAHTAEVQAWQLTVSREEREGIEGTLRNLLDAGHVAAFSVRPVGGATVEEFVDHLRSRIGSVVVDACRDATEGPVDRAPAFLMPVWGFDQAIGGLPVATGRLLGLDLDLIATPSPDQEQGAHLPGHDGRWLIHAGPMF